MKRLSADVVAVTVDAARVQTAAEMKDIGWSDGACGVTVVF